MFVDPEKKKSVHVIIVFWAILMVVLPLSIQAKEFTADLIIKGGQQSDYLYAIYVKNRIYRIQKLKGPKNIPPYPSIVNLENGITWGLNPQLKKYVELKDIEKTILVNPLVGWSFTRQNMVEQLGEDEVLSGYNCKIMLYMEKAGSKPIAKVWFSGELQFIIREERYYGNKIAVMELRNIKQGQLNQELFEIPSDFVNIKDNPDNILAKSSKTNKRRSAGNKHEIKKVEAGSEGTLLVTATKNKQPVKAFVKVFRDKDARYMGGKWSLKDGTAATHKLPKGKYHVKVQDPEERTEKDIGNIVVESGETVSFNTDFFHKDSTVVKSASSTNGGRENESSSQQAVVKPIGDLFDGEIPAMFGAELLSRVSYGPNNKVEFRINEGVESVVDFYKNSLTGKGWQSGLSMVKPAKAILQFKKNTSQVLINISEKNQESTVNIILIVK